MYYFLFSQFLFPFILAQKGFSDNYSDGANYPFLVKIEAKGKILVCAGTILTPCVVLTSAHCVEGVKPSEVTVTHITTSVVKYNVTSTVIHPKYNSTVLANDIALLQVAKIFEKPWEVVTLNDLDKGKPFLKCNSIEIIGWSGQIMKDPVSKWTKTRKTYVEKPMKTTVKLISNENCSAVIKNFGGVFQGEEKLCGVTSEESCFTGPGGPVMCSLKPPEDGFRSVNSVPQHYFSEKKGTLADPIDLLENFKKSENKKFKRELKSGVKNLQVGVVSWGKSCSKVPSVYIRTDFYNDWIKDKSKEMNDLCYYNIGSFTFLTPLRNRGTTCTCSAVFNFVIFFMLITVLLRFL